MLPVLRFDPPEGEEETSFPSPFPGRPGLSQSPISAGFSYRRTARQPIWRVSVFAAVRRPPVARPPADTPGCP
jgi:hypothetical protein